MGVIPSAAVDPIAEQLIARLQRDSADAAAYEELKGHYRLRGDLPSLANLLEGWASTHPDHPEQASDAFCEAATTVLEGLADPPRAKRLYQQALHANVLHPEAGRQLHALLEQLGDYHETTEFLEGYARALGEAGADGGYVGQLFHRLGEIYDEQFGQAEAAQAYYEHAKLLRSSAGTPSPTAASSARVPGAMTHAVTGGPEERADTLERQADAAGTPQAQVELLCELARLRCDELSDLDGAVIALRRALSVVPGDVQVMHQLASCLLARAERGEARAAAADHRRVAELFYQIAQGVADAQALEFLESALQAAPAHDGALSLLEELAPRLGREDLLAGYWVAFVGAAPEGEELDERRVRLGEAYLSAGQLDDALYCLQPAAEHGHVHANELLQQLYARQGREAPRGASAAATTAAATLEAAEGAPEPTRPDRSRLPTTRPPARRSDTELARDAAHVGQLRRQVHDLITARRHDEAADAARAILDIDPNDPEAFNLLEGHYRKRRDYPALRDLLLASTRVPGLSVDARKLRLREVATLSESKIRDTEAAISAWRGVVTLDPADRDATKSLKRLLKRAQQWDELAGVLEREALSATDVGDKKALLREIGLIHRDRRQDMAEAADAFRQLYALDEDDAAIRDDLIALLQQIDAFEELPPLLRERMDSRSEARDKLRDALVLAEVLHEKLADHDGAFELCEQILTLKPGDKGAFDRMQRIDEESGNATRLLGTLERRVELAPKGDRPGLLQHMATLADEELGDLDKAAEYLGDALDLAPKDRETLNRLVEMFERANRYEDLVELLRERALLEKSAKNRVDLMRRIAGLLGNFLGDEQGAAEAYQEVLKVEEDEEALRFLREVATRSDDPAALSDLLQRLSALLSKQLEAAQQGPATGADGEQSETPASLADQTEEIRDLLYDRAVLLQERLQQPQEAAAVLRRLVEELAPDFDPAIELLVEVCEAIDDRTGLAVALERKLQREADAEERLPMAKRLADMAEGELADAALAERALSRWSQDEERNPEPHRRLRAIFERGERWQPLVETLDALGTWEDDFEVRDGAVLQAARLAFEKLDNADGAWNRLLPLVEEGHEAASTLLQEVAQASGRQEAIAALHVRLAQDVEDPHLQGFHWRQAAGVYENQLDNDAQAFEASLRLLAIDLEDQRALELVDRLGGKTGAFKRLSQVYDRLLKGATTDTSKVSLLRRHANLLAGNEPDEALDRVLRACALEPEDEALLSQAEELAQRTGRSEEMLVVYDRRRAKSEDAAGQLTEALRAAKLCQTIDEDERAQQYLKTALAVAAEDGELAERVVQAADELDANAGSNVERRHLRALVRAHGELAETAPAEDGALLVLRAASLMGDRLEDKRGAFDILRQGTARLPLSEPLYERFLACATELSRLDALDAHLSRLVDEAIDSESTVALLKRRAALLEGPLGRARDASTVYAKLLQLRPDDEDIARQLRDGLRASQRYQDLLIALGKQLQRSTDPDQRIQLLKEIAYTWERDLRNRWEALDAWKAVLGQDGEDEEAIEAIERLEKGPGLAQPQAPADEDAQDADAEGPDEDEDEAGDAQLAAPPAEASSEDGDEVAERAAGEAPQSAAQDTVDDDATDRAEVRDEEDDEEDDEDEDETTAPHAIAAAASEANAAQPQAAESEALGAADTNDSGGANSAEDTELDEAHESLELAGAAAGTKAPAPPPPAPPAVDALQEEAEDEDDDDDGDLDSLDASLSATGGGPEELDVLDAIHEVDASEAEELELPPAPPRGRAASNPPPPPPRASVPGSIPPPLPGAAAQNRGSTPPPLPARALSQPPPLPPRSARALSQPPPLPPRSARALSQPPPLPKNPSKPPPLPPRK